MVYSPRKKVAIIIIADIVCGAIFYLLGLLLIAVLGSVL